MRANTSPIFDRLLSWSLRRTLPPLGRYTLATLVILITAIVRSAILATVAPWFLFTPAVLLITLIIGQGAGAYATLLSAVVTGFVISEPSEPFLLSPLQWVASFLYIVSTLGVVAVAAELRAAFRRMERILAERAADNLRIGEREAFLSSVLGSSTDCIKVLDLDGRMTFMSEGGMKVMEVSDFNAVAGCPWPDFWQDAGNDAARRAVEEARQGRSSSFTNQAATFAGNVRWWDVAVSPILGADGRPERILSVSRDVTASREAEESRNQLARIVENSLDFIGMARLDESVFFMNDAALRLVGLECERMQHVKIADFFPPNEAEAVRDVVLPAVARDGSWSGERHFRHFVTGELIPVLYTVFQVQDRDGQLIGYGTVTRDYRGLKKAQEQQELLNNELSHRLKNVLAIVQSVAAQSLRQADTLEAANTALGARLSALGEATNVLTATSWSAADLKELATKALAPQGTIGEQFMLEGPEVTLKPQVALAFALALHELATNASKYGSLSCEGGHVELRWWITDGTEPGGGRLCLKWQELGGPEVVPPSRKGFGSMMIERSLRSYFRGSATIDYVATGLVFSLDAPLSEAAVERGA